MHSPIRHLGTFEGHRLRLERNRAEPSEGLALHIAASLLTLTLIAFVVLA